ncbi:DNA-3-methyladenine glycosylase family protein [Bacillus coahuilensis]|uniref:DNA-3-methyladenine glycosylase family protein n=1 Tax=Bacillus coahuilensis TaxID=408580 RepID=UPI0007502E4E|nr:DNA-3-methyladenine glycosylase [Bacillus coahuilensis]
MEVRVSVEQPYDVESVLSYFTGHPLVVVEQSGLRFGLDHGVRSIIDVKYEGEIAIIHSEIDDMKFIEKTMHILHLDRPLKPIDEFYRKSELQEIFQKYEGYPLLLELDDYMSIIRCIISQQVNLTLARNIFTSLTHTYGEEVDGVWFFPRPHVLKEVSIEELRTHKLSQRKAEYIQGFASLVADGAIDMDELDKLSNDEIFDRLLPIRGIGKWTVENYLLFTLGRENLFPKGDIGIQNALKKFHQLDRKPTMDEMDINSRDWAPYLSYASIYLWRSLENGSEQTNAKSKQTKPRVKIKPGS